MLREKEAMRQPAGDVHVLPPRPCPLVCTSAMHAEPEHPSEPLKNMSQSDHTGHEHKHAQAQDDEHDSQHDRVDAPMGRTERLLIMTLCVDCSDAADSRVLPKHVVARWCQKSLSSIEVVLSVTSSMSTSCMTSRFQGCIAGVPQLAQHLRAIASRS